MKILIVGLVNNPQFKRVREEANSRGHTVDGCYASELVIYSTHETFEPTLRGRKLEDYDLIYLWTVGKRRWEWYVAVEYLNTRFGTLIVNKVVIDSKSNYSPTPALSYLKQFENKLPFPASAVVFSHKSVESVEEKFKFPVIVKSSTAHKGKGVFKADNADELRHIIKENKDISPAFIIRELIPNDGDIRVFCVGYKAIGAMKRTPKKGEFRSNISLGGKGEKFDLQSAKGVKELAEKAAEVTGIEIAGVD
ncbi:ATP-grasp domain-containing protein, partial [Patescibacteria group bacterium]|nr:ATP-grasp domain-containing protein [Patescibacteria group bacterium]